MQPISRLLIIATIIAVMPFPAFAYIDPGTVSMVIQGFFAIFFGAATAWVMRPWQALKSLFRRRKAVPSSSGLDTTASRGNSDPTTLR